MEKSLARHVVYRDLSLVENAEVKTGVSMKVAQAQKLGDAGSHEKLGAEN